MRYDVHRDKFRFQVFIFKQFPGSQEIGVEV